MSILVRKINRAKWPNDRCGIKKIRADAITYDLKTRDDSISVWRINSKEEVDEAIVALASNCDSISKIDVVLMEEQHLKRRKVRIDDNIIGDTPYTSFNEKHCHIHELNIKSLATVAKHIGQRLLLNGTFYRRTAGQVKRLLIKAIEDDKLLVSELSDGIHNKII